MPNRIIKESICTSDSIDSLDWFSEVLFYRLIVNCDDYGRFYGRTAIIKNRLFPLKESLTLKNVENAINKLASVGLVFRYEANGKPFLLLPTWNVHQSVRAKNSKFPAPDSICKQMDADDSICSRNPIQYENDILPPISPQDADASSEAAGSERRYKAEKHRHGEYNNVLLTDEELRKLQDEYPDWAERIERLSAYVASTGKAYKSHYVTIRNWARKDTEQGVRSVKRSSYNRYPQHEVSEADLSHIFADLSEEV